MDDKGRSGGVDGRLSEAGGSDGKGSKSRARSTERAGQ